MQCLEGTLSNNASQQKLLSFLATVKMQSMAKLIDGVELVKCIQLNTGLL